MTARITWRKLVFALALLLAAYALAQVFSLGMALAMAGDVAAYCELATAVMVVTAASHLRHAIQTISLRLTGAMRRMRI